MNVSDIDQEIQDHGFANTTTAARRLAYINDAIWDVCSRVQWPFLEKTIALTFNGSSAAPTNWPTDFKSVQAMVNTTTGATIMPERVDFLDKRNALNLTEAGDPVWYYFRGSGGTSSGDVSGGPGQPAVCNFWPIPPSGQSVQMRYLAQHPQVSAGTTESGIWIPPQHHRVIVLGALWKCYDQEDDPGMATRFQQLFEARIESMKRDVFQRQVDRPERIYVIGYDDYDLDYYY